MGLPGYRVDEVTGVKYLIWGDSQYSFSPPADCPMPETEKLSHYLLDVFVALSVGDIEIIDHNPLIPSPSLELSQCLRSIDTRLGNMETYQANLTQLSTIAENIGAALTSLEGMQESLISLSVIGLNVESLAEQLTLLQADFNAFKLQIDRLYIDTINVDAGEVGGETAAAIENAFMHEKGATKYSILNTALLRPEVIPGDEDLRSVGDMVSHIETIQEDLVSLEMTESTIEIAPGTLVYAKTKVVRE
jgi:hypothetical protein